MSLIVRWLCDTCGEQWSIDKGTCNAEGCSGAAMGMGFYEDLPTEDIPRDKCGLCDEPPTQGALCSKCHEKVAALLKPGVKIHTVNDKLF